jgi:hypothetical protein
MAGRKGVGEDGMGGGKPVYQGFNGLRASELSVFSARNRGAESSSARQRISIGLIMAPGYSSGRFCQRNIRFFAFSRDFAFKGAVL